MWHSKTHCDATPCKTLAPDYVNQNERAGVPLESKAGCLCAASGPVWSVLGAADGGPAGPPRSSRLFNSTAMLLKAIAAPDSEGFRAIPYAGSNAPAAQQNIDEPVQRFWSLPLYQSHPYLTIGKLCVVYPQKNLLSRSGDSMQERITAYTHLY